jgi:hypothetical protein
MAVTAGGRWVPAPGISSSPPPLPKPREIGDRSIDWHGRRYRLPRSAELKIRGPRLWIRDGAIVAAHDTDGPVILDDDEARMLATAEGWTLL